MGQLRVVAVAFFDLFSASHAARHDPLTVTTGPFRRQGLSSLPNRPTNKLRSARLVVVDAEGCTKLRRSAQTVCKCLRNRIHSFTFSKPLVPSFHNALLNLGKARKQFQNVGGLVKNSWRKEMTDICRAIRSYFHHYIPCKV